MKLLHVGAAVVLAAVISWVPAAPAIAADTITVSGVVQDVTGGNVKGVVYLHPVSGSSAKTYSGKLTGGAYAITVPAGPAYQLQVEASAIGLGTQGVMWLEDSSGRVAISSTSGDVVANVEMPWMVSGQVGYSSSITRVDTAVLVLQSKRGGTWMDVGSVEFRIRANVGPSGHGKFQFADVEPADAYRVVTSVDGTPLQILWVSTSPTGDELGDTSYQLPGSSDPTNTSRYVSITYDPPVVEAEPAPTPSETATPTPSATPTTTAAPTDSPTPVASESADPIAASSTSATNGPLIIVAIVLGLATAASAVMLVLWVRARRAGQLVEEPSP